MAQNPLSFGNYDLSDKSQQKLFLQQLSVVLNQIYQPSFLAGVLNGSYALKQPQVIVQVKSTPTTNQTVDTGKSPLVWLDYNWATAANFTATLNNVVDGQLVCFQFGNVSGAARIVTLAANTPTPTSMTVLTGNNNLGAGVSVANNVTVLFVGMASATNLVLQGVGQNW